MEIEKSVIRFSPQDIDEISQYSDYRENSDLTNYTNVLQRRLAALEEESPEELPYRLPCIEVPYSKKLIGIMACASAYAVEKRRQEAADKERQAAREWNNHRRAVRRDAYLNRIVINLSLYRRQKRG